MGWGAVVGALLGAVFALVEPFGVGRSARGGWGASPLHVLGVYLAFGWVLGVAVSVALGAVKALRRSHVRAAGSVAAVVGWLLTLLFVVRGLTVPEIRASAASLALPVGMASVLCLGLFVAGLLRPARRRKRRGAAAALLGIGATALVVAVNIAAHRRDTTLPGNAAAQDSPNIVLIVVDAMRADHLGAYGYARNTSPFIDRLAQEGVLFQRAYAQGNRTIISMPSIFTSLYPSFHGAVGRGNIVVPLPPSRTTIAEILQARGYATVALMTNIYMKHPYGLTQGFDRVDEFNTGRFELSVYRVLLEVGLVRRPHYKVGVSPFGAEVTERAIEWIRRLHDRPFFLYVHYMDVHHPYAPPPDVFAEFDRKTSAMPADSLFALTARLVNGPRPVVLEEALRERLIDCYDACIASVDQQISRLVGELRRSGPGRPTVVVLTADHGDEFLEAGSLYHTNVLIQPLLHVPLVFWRTDGEWPPRRVTETARHVDLLPTLAEIAGQPVPAGVVGQSLVPALRGQAWEGADTSFAEGDGCAALLTDRWKLMALTSRGEYFLYDLASDSTASIDVAAAHPKELDALRERLDDYLRRAAEADAAGDRRTANKETVRELRALGYLQ